MVNRVKSESPEPQVNILALTRSGESYLFFYEDHQSKEVLRRFGLFAGNPELSFTWYDAAVLSQKVRERINGTD